ncbi:MAG: glutamine-hydrolyzing carbamoyl-phosphate synthase small subunit [Thermodesulfobacteriota bacterium]|jgi:carbamoyl-phosphate synthase small subunit|nr:MAG: glutamine-hydrolyzing carbamoyl-phosphate synthase small subunit [Thermodesulfobacteriota bacterium]
MTIAKAILCLENGRTFLGESFGAQGETTGEVVFNTSLSGYQEVLTDPSYKGQIVTMTYPLIGNYGINEEDSESEKPQVEGFVVRELSSLPSNWRSQKTLDEYFKEYSIVGIQGIDTRALTKHIRDAGAQLGIISTVDLDPQSLREKLEKAPQYVGRDLVKEVTCNHSYEWKEGTWSFPGGDKKPSRPKEERFNVIVYDYGVKRNILRHLVDEGCDVTVVPASFPAEDVLGLRPQGVCLSNGPGDPAALPYVVDNIKKLIGKLPIMGICMGHQILGLALGGKTYKLKFGHRGGNQPVKDLVTGNVAITAQNHGFCVDLETLDTREVFLTHINLNDQTLEGFQHKQLPLFSVQYHPEAAPGPHDASYLFKQFCELMKHAQAN